MRSSAKRVCACFATAAIATLGANAYALSGKVVDKRFRPIAAAKVCLGNPAIACAATGMDGTFRLEGSTSLRAASAAALPLPAKSIPSRFAADGRRLAGRRTHGFQSFALRRERRGPQGNAGETVAKRAATTLVAAKAGYATTLYNPPNDTAQAAVIVMGGEGENVKALFDGSSLSGWSQVPAASWEIKNGVLASKGLGRGEMYTAEDYPDYRIIFSVRQISGNHNPCVLYFCQRPPAGQNGLDALGAIQWQAPTTGTWDYRPGKNNSGSAYYTALANPHLDKGKWAQCEMIVHGSSGKARMGCCQESPAGPCKGVEMLRFQDASAARSGPFALQMHNGGLFDEYKDISIEIDPKDDSLFIAE